MQTPGAHLQLLRHLQARLRMQLWLEGAFWGTCTLLLGLWLAVGVSFFDPQVAVIVVLFLAAGLFVWTGPYRAWRRSHTLAQTARILAHALPQETFDWLSAVELQQEAEQSKSTHTSPALTQAFLHQLDERSVGISVKQVVSKKPLRRAQAAFFFAVALWLSSYALWPSVWKSGLLRLATVAKEGKPRSVEPITGDVELTYRYPAYTGLLERVIPGTAGEISAPKGTVVHLKTHADREVTRADVVLEGNRIPLQVQNGRDLEGQFIVEKTGSYQFRFFRTGDTPIAEGPPLSIAVENDALPQIHLLSPQAELEVEPGQKVTLQYEASDDYGLANLNLVYQARGAPEVRVPLKMDEGRRFKGTYVWDLASMKAAPGEQIAYFLDVKDNDAIDGPKRGVSRTQFLKWYDAAEHRRNALKKAEELWEKLLTHVADRIEGPDVRPAASPEALITARSTDAKGLALAQEFLEAGQELSKQKDAPSEWVSALANISQSLRKGVRTTADSREGYARMWNLKQSQTEPRQQLVVSVRREIAQTEKDALYLETLLDRQKLQDLKEMAAQLQKDRRQLASLIEDFKKTQDEKTKEAILQEIRQMKSRISELMQRMAELSKGIRDEHVNQEVLQEMMEEKGMTSALEDIERLMREGKTDEALAKLQELGMDMEEMFEQLESGEEDMGADQFPELAKDFQDFMEELNSTTEQQQKLAQQTKEVRDTYRKQQKERLVKQGQAMKQELLKKAEEVLKDYQAVEASDPSPRLQQPLAQAQAELESLKSALQVNDFDLATEAAERAQSHAEDLAENAEAQSRFEASLGAPPSQQRPSQQQAEKLTKDASKVEALRKKLESLFPKPGAQMSERDRQHLKNLSQKQRQLEQKAERLQQRMNEMSQEAPLFNDEAVEQMEGISQRMSDAAGKMESQDAHRGWGDQQAALEQLQQFQKQMQQGRSGKGKKGGLPLPMMAGRGPGFGQQSRDKVEVPDADDSQAPKEFRKDLLDAMKQGAPDKYKDQVKRYYEELVK